MPTLLPWIDPAFAAFAWTMPVALLYALLLGAAAVWDAATYRIPNALTLGLAGAFLPAAAMAPGPVDWFGHLAACGAMLAAGLVLFATRVMGGGDVKLLAGAALWVGLPGLPAAMAVTAMAGGVLALALILARRTVVALAVAPVVARVPWLGALLPSRGVPYGVAIAAGALAAAPLSPLLRAFG